MDLAMEETLDLRLMGERSDADRLFKVPGGAVSDRVTARLAKSVLVRGSMSDCAEYGGQNDQQGCTLHGF
jgi:hypothetical protein